MRMMDAKNADQKPAVSELLDFAIKNKASDLHLSAGLPPMFRIDGDLHLFDYAVLPQKDITDMLYVVMNDEQRAYYKKNLEVDFSYGNNTFARFRVNVYTQERGSAAVFRIIPTEIATMDDLHLLPIFKNIASFSQGLVLVTGPTGSGKSTTLAAMIDYINSTRYQHIITIEDPIEFVHHSKKSLINQREVHRDTHSFSTALRSALRQDPDIILVGELRDLESIRLAMTAAETGHLVFATLHTSSATKTINRIIDVFPGDEKAMIRSMLSGSLQAVVAQTLLKRPISGRVAALEIMLCTPAIRSMIREDKIAQMYSSIQTGKGLGMQTLDQHLTQLVQDKLISTETAQRVALNKELL